MKKTMKLLAVLLTMAMVFVLPVEASAATRKITVKNSEYLYPADLKKATAVKYGKNVVTCISGGGTQESIMKFTAPKTTTYTFTFSNLRIAGKTSAQSFATENFYFFDTIKIENGGTLFSRLVRKCTIYGLLDEHQLIYIVTPSYKKARKTGMTSCTVIVRMKKGQTIYMPAYDTDYLQKRTFNLTIKYFRP